MYVKDAGNNAFYVYATSVTILIKEVLSLFEKVILDAQPFRFTKYYHVSSRKIVSSLIYNDKSIIVM